MLRYLIFFIFAWISVNGINWHSSQITLGHLYDLQNEQFAITKDYLELETKRIRELQRNLIPAFKWHINNKFKKDRIPSHTNNFKLISRICNILPKILNLTNNEQSVELFKKFDEEKAISDFNLQSAHLALRRLQRVYAIPASYMAAGRYKERTIGDRMDAYECYVMAKFCFKNGDMYGVIDWAIQAYNKWFESRSPRVDIEKLEYFLTLASMITGFKFEPYKELHNSENSEKTALHNLLMANDLFLQDIGTQSDIYDIYDEFEYHARCKNFRKLCRTGKSVRPLTNESKCRYQTKNSLYRLLMPFKEEDISNSPYVKLYHDVLYDEEIRTVTEMAKKDLTDAAYYLNGKISLIDEKRLGQLKWFSESVNPELFGKLNERVECLTDFSTVRADEYQTVNYGMGGHFTVHVDAFTDGLKLDGNRIVTVLFYMTDVPDDGFTVFPNINYVAHCRKGTALVWQNLYLNNGTVHSGTYHGGCPVLKGNKWIMSKGLNEGGQHLKYNWEANKQIIIV